MFLLRKEVSKSTKLEGAHMACGGVMFVSPYLQKAYPLGTWDILIFVYLARMYLARVNETGQTARVLSPKLEQFMPGIAVRFSRCSWEGNLFMLFA